MIIGVTGSFGSGKTIVANVFSKYGFRVINVDKLYHNIYKKNILLKIKIRKEFKTLDRNKIKKIVFKDSRKLKKLNSITHPVIIKALKKEINRIKKSNKETKIVVDVPLLFEAKMERLFDKIIVVKCNKKTQVNRILKKKKHSKKEIEQIIKSQMPLKEKLKKADFVVDNSKSSGETKKRIKKIIGSLMSDR